MTALSSMLSVAWIGALSSILFWLLFLGGLYVYTALARQISARLPALNDETASLKTFGIPEAIVALVLISFLLLNVMASLSAPSAPLSSRDLVANLVLLLVLIFLLIGFLELRRLNVERLAGLSKLGIVRAISIGALLLLAGYPLVSAADAVTQRFVEDTASKQNIVEMFNASRTIDQRMMIIVLAVAVAPIAEEFVFRFFLYGVLRRYFGRFGALIFTALLFAAVHAHLPSFAPLFILGACFTIAYEWSGSILVSMTMHSLFNSLSLIFLAFPQLSDQ
ncbi:MAG TPA: CPBP family intramembrane glutamic endopeptidase [Chthoniobacterales bacterium]